MTRTTAADTAGKAPLHKGPMVLSLIFAAAAMAMPWVGTLPTHLAIACKAMALMYAAGLMAIAFAPLRQPGQSVEEAYGSKPFFAKSDGRVGRTARA